jgi:hypothetical protein
MEYKLVYKTPRFFRGQYNLSLPNPTHGTTTVCGYMYGYQNIELYDLQGRKLGNLVENGSQIPTLDLSPYPAGTYLVKINFARGVSVTRKVVKGE